MHVALVAVAASGNEAVGWGLSVAFLAKNGHVIAATPAGRELGWCPFYEGLRGCGQDHRFLRKQTNPRSKQE